MRSVSDFMSGTVAGVEHCWFILTVFPKLTVGAPTRHASLSLSSPAELLAEKANVLLTAKDSSLREYCLPIWRND